MADRDTGPSPTGPRSARSPAATDLGQRPEGAVAMVEEAVAAGRVRLAYQPIMVAGSGRNPAFYEGLIRVLDRSGRVIPACDFIAEVEETALGRRIDAMALSYGLQALAERAQLRLSINLSVRTIGDPGWMAALDAGLAADPTVAERLILELTESSAITQPDEVGAFIARMQERGIAIAVDDFGAGYTSMRHLRDFRFDILKIDGALCGDAAANPDNRALIAAIVSIAAHFEMMTVAERVETAEDAEALARIGVDCLQGYLFARPTLLPEWRDCAIGRSA